MSMERDLFYEVIVPFVEKLFSFFSITGGNVINYQMIMDSTYLKAADYIKGVTAIAETLLPLAMMLLLVRWSISLLQDVLSSELDIEIFVRNFIRLVIGAIIVSNSIQLMQGIVEFGDTLLSEIMTAGGGLSTIGKETIKEIIDFSKEVNSDSSVTGLIGVITSLIVSYLEPLTFMIVGFFLYIHGWQRSIAITQMFIYAPVAFSDCFRGGMQSGAVSYARKMLALIMEPLIVYIALKSYIFFASNTTIFDGVANPFLLPWLQLILILAAISFIRSAKKISEEIFT